MTESRALRLKALFDEALTLPAERRRAFVAERCADDAALAAELESLLTAHTQTDDIGSAIAAAADSFLGRGDSDPAAEGRRIGAYRVIREIGRGGMGRVYLAERDDAKYSAQVAIKLLAPGAAGTAGGERFRNECQVLADLHHPNIAQLLDAGTTDDGEPYLVIEYVEGEAVDTYCDARKLSVSARIALFEKLCDAVEHAHRNLVVHRDIKASNVLVTAEGELKLLDFGIAKLLDAERARTLDLHLTGDASRLLTPITASPEQLKGESVTTATDVYALGHLLYRLLTGTMPHEAASKDRFALPRAILDDEPQRPSLAVQQNADAATRRGTTPAQLARQLDGDLDAIVLKALRKAPGDRYAGPLELADDLANHLARRPVRARGEALGYVTRRFVARNRSALAVALSVVVLVVSLVAFYTAQLATERDRARIEARRAEEVATFLTNLFEIATPDESRGARVTAREMLDRGAQRIGVDLRSEPEVQASLMRVIGSAYGKLGLYDSAIESLENALATREALGGADDVVLGDALHDLGSALLSQARYEEAEAVLDRALTVRRNVHGPVHANVAATLRMQAGVAFEVAQYERMATLLDEAEGVVRSMQPAEPLALASVLLARGDLLRQLGDYDAAIANQGRAAEIRRDELGPEHTETLIARKNLSDTLNAAGRRTEAETILRDILDVRRRVLPAGHEGIALALAALSESIKLQGRPEEAERLQSEALAILRAAHDGDHPDVAVALNNLANLRHDLRDLDGALALHEESLAMNRRLYGDDHPSLADSYNNIAALQADRNDFAGALLMYEKTLALDSRTLGDDHPFVGYDRLGIGVMQGLLGRAAEAETNLRRALAHIRRVSGEDHPQAFNAMRELGIFLQREGRCDEAEPLLADALPGLEQAFPGDPWQVATARTHLGACRAQTDPAAGEPLIRQGYERLVETLGADGRMAVQAKAVLRDFLVANDRIAEARELEQAESAAN